MAGALQDVTTRTNDGIEARELDVRALLKALPEPEMPEGLEDRLRAFLQGRRGFVGH